MNDLVKRSITGLVFISIIITSVIASVLSWGIIAGIIAVLGSYELAKLQKKAGFINTNAYFAAAMSFFTFSSLFLFFLEQSLAKISLIVFSIAFVALIIKSLISKNKFNTFVSNLIASVVIAMPFALSVFIVLFPLDAGHDFSDLLLPNLLYFSPHLLLSVFILIWVFDVFAYLGGTLFGKHKILPKVSPSKSWEGFVFGLIFLIPSSILLTKYVHLFSIAQWLGLSIIIAFTGSFGDFFFSAVKRKAGVKDSGKILPGHGGILDRFDSFIFVIPFAAFYFVIISLF